MRRTRFAPIAVVPLAVVMAVALAACGSSTAQVSGPRPQPDLARLKLTGDGGKADAALYPQEPPHYVLDGTLADLGFEAPVRTLVGHEVSEADVARIGAALGLHAAPTRTDWGYEVRDGDALLNIDTTSGATWIDYSAAGNAGAGAGGSTGSGSSASNASGPSSGPADVPPDAPDPPVTIEPDPPVPMPTIPPPVDVPSADDATAIAQSLLDDLGVLTGQQWAHDVTDTSNDVAVSCDSDYPCPQPDPSPVSERTVTFDLVLDGTRVPGVGWTVTVGSHRRVEALSGTWARPELAGSYALRSTTATFDDLQQGKAQLIGAQALAEDAAGASEATTDPTGTVEPAAAPDTHVTGVALGIARWDGVEDGRPVVYLVPTYRFQARTGDSTSVVEVLALDPAGFTVTAPAVDTPLGG